MVAIIIASAFLGLGTALFYWIKVSSIPLTHGIENKEDMINADEKHVIFFINPPLLVKNKI